MGIIFIFSGLILFPLLGMFIIESWDDILDFFQDVIEGIGDMFQWVKKKWNWHWFSRKTKTAKDGYITFSFKKFLDLYNINPDKWKWNFYKWEENPKVIYNFNDKKTEFHFTTYADVRKFKRWANKEVNRIRNQKKYSDAFEDMQNDIEKRMKEAKEIQDTAWQRMMAARSEQAQQYIDAEKKMQQLARKGV